MKTTQQIYDQHSRIYRMLGARCQRLAANAHPETGGNVGLVHNWGNDAAKAIVADCDRIWSRVDKCYKRLYAEAEHRTHGPHFRPTWCEHCRSAHQDVSNNLKVTFKAKIKRGIIDVPAIKRHHCDMHAFRTSRHFGQFANSDLFANVLKRAFSSLGIPEWFYADQPPANVTVDASGFLATVRIDVPDSRCW